MYVTIADLARQLEAQAEAVDTFAEDLREWHKLIGQYGEQQRLNFVMTDLLRTNLAEQQRLLAAMSEVIQALGVRIAKLERAVSPVPVFFDPRGGTA